MQKEYLPKVILHEHIEGSITPAMAKTLALKNGFTFPNSLCYQQGEYDEQAFPNGRYCYDETKFTEFVNTYDTVANFIKTPHDYYLITKDFLLRNARQGLIYCELFISPYHMCTSEVNGKLVWLQDRFYEILSEMNKAIDEVNQTNPITVRYHVIGIRHLGTEAVYNTLQFIAQHPHSLITGFNIAGNEKAGHFDDFEASHQLASTLGLGKSYHAGEIESSQSIINALNHGAIRIGHGIRAIENHELIQRIIKQNVTLEIALTSNRILVNELQGDIHLHPVRKLYDLGVRITLNTDDAGIFGTDIAKEYQIAQSVFGFSRLELLDISLCGIDAAFIDSVEKDRLKDIIFSAFTLQDVNQLKSAITLNQYHSTIIARFESYLAQFS